jgi:hypothetical protein
MDLEQFKHRILFNEIHSTERSEDFARLCREISNAVRHGFEFYDSLEGPYISFLKLAGGVIRREHLIALCEDLKATTDWKSLHQVWNDGDDTYYQDHFTREIKSAKKIMKNLRPFVIEETKSWTEERRHMDLVRPEGRFMKGWFETKGISNKHQP